MTCDWAVRRFSIIKSLLTFCQMHGYASVDLMYAWNKQEKNESLNNLRIFVERKIDEQILYCPYKGICFHCPYKASHKYTDTCTKCNQKKKIQYRTFFPTISHTHSCRHTTVVEAMLWQKGHHALKPIICTVPHVSMALKKANVSIIGCFTNLTETLQFQHQTSSLCSPRVCLQQWKTMPMCTLVLLLFLSLLNVVSCFRSRTTSSWVGRSQTGRYSYFLLYLGVQL